MKNIDLINQHYDTFINLSRQLSFKNPFKNEFVNHLLHDYLYDSNCAYNDFCPVVLDLSQAEYADALTTDIKNAKIIVSCMAKVFEDNSSEIESYSDDPTKTIDISQEYMDDFYNLYNEYLK